MKYIIMCGGDSSENPKHIREIDGEPIIARTVRLLRENGIKDIAISSNNPIFEGFGVPVLKHENGFEYGKSNHKWLEGFYPMQDPVCYIFGDVFFSEYAIRTIVKVQADGILFFASAPPFAPTYPKRWAEPFAFKVMRPDAFFEKIRECHRLDLEGKFKREPIAWELWQVIKGTPLNSIDYTNYTAVNDYSCDIDSDADFEALKRKRGHA